MRLGDPRPRRTSKVVLIAPILSALYASAAPAVRAVEAPAQDPAVSTPAVTASSAAAEPEVTLSAAGDIRLDGRIAEIAAQDGVDGPSREVKPLLAADIVFGNLETPVTTRGVKTVKTWNF